MRKNAPKVLAVFLLLIIAALMIVAGSGSLKSLFDQLSPADANGDDIILPPPDDNEEPDPPEETPVFPKAPRESELFVFTQSVEIQGTITADAILQTTDFVYLIVTSDSTGGDFTVPRKSVSVLKMTYGGTILKVLNLTLASPSYYLASGITAEGLAVIVSDSQKTYSLVIGYDFETATKEEFPEADSARVFPLDEGFLLILEAAKNTVRLVKDGAKKSAELGKGKILEAFDFGTRFMFLINDSGGFWVKYLDNNLSPEASSFYIPNKTALSVLPLVEGGAQKFIVAEKESGGIYLTKYDRQMKATEERVALGLAPDADAYLNGNTILIFMKNPSRRVYIAEYDLSVISSSASYLENVAEIYSCRPYRGGYLALAKAASSSVEFLNFRDDGSLSFIELPSGPNGGADFIRTPDDGKAILLYEGDEAGKIDIVCVEV
jgi:hypothetical protein